MAAILGKAARLLPRHDTSHFTPAEMAEMLIDPYEKAPKYAKTAIGVLCGLVAIFGLINLFASIFQSRFAAPIRRSKAYRRTVAFYRYIETSQPRAIGWCRFPTKGVILLLVFFYLFAVVWTFAQTPYYRSRWNVGSPPLAIRTGLLALGCFPFILALGAKVNLIGFIVGASHEKLQVFHQWLSWLFLFLSLLHTFPFVVQGTREIRPNTDGRNPNHLSQLEWSWHVKHSVYYWSGIAALVPLAWLCFASFGPIRRAAYEFFKWMHLVSAILFSAFFYIHCNALLTSWHYIWATAAVYFTSVLIRFAVMLNRNGRHIARGHIEVLPDNAVRVTARLPHGAGHAWSAGQHYFVNFVKARPFESHPYTVANAPWYDPSSSQTPDKLVLIFRVSPTQGLGPRLLSLAESSSPTTPLLLDGPYGGLSAYNRDYSRHDVVFLIAGGAGISACTAVLEELGSRIIRREPGVRTTRIALWWMVRDESAGEWVEAQLAESTKYLRDMVDLRLFVTGDATAGNLDSPSLQTASDEKLEIEEEKPVKTSCCRKRAKWTVERGRPDLLSLLPRRFDTLQPDASVGIVSCGPTSLATDVRNAVAARQWKIATGREEGGISELELHTEEFDW
ncbi:hypothetical protein JCM10908_006795 [Rhodotorula pacifica]|uniref:uncharacterized protein n=1 Tax=Rhodotorula pacifica TaxID=1495444 RepID=UPI00317696F4